MHRLKQYVRETRRMAKKLMVITTPLPRKAPALSSRDCVHAAAGVPAYFTARRLRRRFWRWRDADYDPRQRLRDSSCGRPRFASAGISCVQRARRTGPMVLGDYLHAGTVVAGLSSSRCTSVWGAIGIWDRFGDR